MPGQRSIPTTGYWLGQHQALWSWILVTTNTQGAELIQWHWLDPPSTKLRMKNVNSYLFFASRNICVWGQMWGIEWKMLPEKEVKFLKPKLTHFCPLPSSQINIFSIYNDAALYSSLPLLSSTTTKIFLPILVNKLDFCRRKMLPI